MRVIFASFLPSFYLSLLIHCFLFQLRKKCHQFYVIKSNISKAHLSTLLFEDFTLVSRHCEFSNNNKKRPDRGQVTCHDESCWAWEKLEKSKWLIFTPKICKILNDVSDIGIWALFIHFVHARDLLRMSEHFSPDEPA